MNALFVLVALASTAHAQEAPNRCYITSDAITVSVSDEAHGPLQSFDASDIENKDGRATCSGYLAAFREAYGLAAAQAETLRAAGECSAVIDTVSLAEVTAAANAKPGKKIQGSGFPEDCAN